ncbi:MULTISPECIES: hypothetical protein [Hymenobacter]|uniref:Uncharacterized protein n=3 Tax=Hymenobacter TaxID=89966 RepID=A0ABR7MI16_9BACT|nr:MULTISPECIES: hypothetical protein [Hymenobacter]MBC6610734.1 hypothetical protein [Hymenobacter citatus]MBO3273064.1 hypothetical protein [Hymenobacter defluvii]MBW3127858.1 hypothetical protein [Hymenobacter profundi]QNE40372.1 hypothetical protein F1C16_12800 [Hymenobacter sp. NBH84]
MANDPKKNNQAKTDLPKEGDPLFNLHHAQAEAELAKKNGGLGPTTNEYMTEDEQDNVDASIAPRDSQGFVRGQDDSDVIGSNAGDHK